ncbi:hypothetical protein TG4357_03394 [Thalassovita gelatinovora]|uniref:Uncharacterized protein n=1 Tax=Thalassovita gelatinovora TaxID=53501 RepID=A0A0P1FKZ5_THAGE|nr:hypothetical protein [Thalassovita gelatinovora]QIZ81634.1 hypothetical protein HFZ77_14665 [Thalassovita gelatinovora]CUH68109.1 hypothetical protein TG4357_03394 [Thalassovita gelatinovora]SEQ29360.1 hypothetical protein SAMN04488043_104266 [Thalassovita gelatinovora]
MFAVADTEKLVADGIITPLQAKEITNRARDAMITLAVNSVLCLGILAATAGFILWLANPVAVALLGSLMLAGGIAILARGANMVRMFGNAASLIGAGLLLGGGTVELLMNFEHSAGWIMTAVGAITTALSALALTRKSAAAGFVIGAILLMGVGLHLFGLGFLFYQFDLFGAVKAGFFLYAFAVIAGAGWFTDVRLITALSIVPFAQALDTGTEYFHAAYVFYSPEPVLSILQLSALIALCLWIAARRPGQVARHAGILAILAFIVANMSALVGSLWGNTVGETIWGPEYSDFSGTDGQSDFEQYQAAQEAFRDMSLHISANVFSVLWAIALVAIVFWAAHRNKRGLFNAAMTFGAIHAYTQFFESFADEPLAYVIGGLAAIPLAWGMWRLNATMLAKSHPLADRPI